MRLFRVRSLQLQLALSLAGLYVVATAIVTAAVVHQAYSSADALTKEDLNRRAHHLALEVAADGSGEPTLTLPAWLASLYDSGDFLYAVRYPDGPEIATSNPLVDGLVFRLPTPDDASPFFRLRHFGPTEREYFGTTVPVESAVGKLWITIARASDDDILASALLREFVFNLAWLVPLVVATTLAIGVFTIRRGLRPLREASAKAATIDPGAISVRLPEEHLPSEVQPLVAAVNHALERLEKGFAVQRRFTANAAHELRTPLAILTAAIDHMDSNANVAALKADAARMNRLVEQLLRVARLDSVALDVSATIDLGSAATSVVEYMAPIAVSNGRALAVQGADEPVLVKGNPYALEDAIRNLIENAIAHAPDNTEVVVGVHPEGMISVADRGPGVPTEDRNNIFDRFWRGRNSRGQGSGLGLAIVSETMKAHRGSVEVSDNPGGGALFMLVFPSLASFPKPQCPG